jgi:hypothetical protein
MSLDIPRTYFHGMSSTYRAESPRWSKVNAYRGIHRLEISVSKEPIPTSTTLDVVWPKRLPGFLALMFFEDNERHKKVPYLAVGDEDPKEKEDQTQLALLRLWRPPGKDVRADFEGELLLDPDKVLFLGVTVNVKVRIRAGESAGSPVETTFYVKNLPILSQDFDVHEGALWELGAHPMFVPLARQSLYDTFWEDHAFWHPYKDRGLLKAALKGGQIGRAAYTNLTHARSMWFEERYDGETVERMSDRWLLALNWFWLSGKRSLYRVGGHLIKFPANPDVRIATRYTCDLDFRPGSGIKSALTPLLRLPHPTRKGKWIRDVVISSPKKDGQVRSVIALGGVPQAFWRLPDGADPRKGPVSLRKVGAQGVRVRPGEKTKIVFEVTSPAARFKFVLKELLERLTLVNAHKERFRRLQKSNRNELDTWNFAVAPLYNAFGRMKFTSQEWFGKKGSRSWEECSAAAGRWSQRARTEGLEVKGRIDIRETFATLGGLSFHQKKAQEHMQKAWTLFCSPEFQDPFQSGSFLGKGLKVTLGAAEDGTLIAVPTVTGNERKHLKSLRDFEKDYEYNDDLIQFILNNLGLNFPLMSSTPKPGDPSPAARKQANRKALEARRDRSRKFAAFLGSRLTELMKAKPGEAGEGVKSSLKWIGAPGKLNYWDSVTGGGLAVLFYGNSQQRDLMSRKVLNLPDAKSFWRLNNQEWDKISDDIRRRHGKEAAGRSNSDTAFFLGLMGQAVSIQQQFRKGVKGDLKSIVELMDVVVGSLESLVKLGMLLRPVYYRLRMKIAGGITTAIEAGLVGEGMLLKGGKVVGEGLKKVAAIVGIVKAGVDLLGMYTKWKKGFDVSWAELGFTILELIAAVLFFINPVVGAVLGALVLIGQLLYSYFSETAMEGMLVWWLKTPWGMSRDPMHHFSVIPASQPGKIVELAQEKLNPFMEKACEAIADDGKLTKAEKTERIADLHSYLKAYFAVAAKKFGLRVNDRSTKHVVKFDVSGA